MKAHVSSLFIDRPIGTSLMAVAIILAGWIAYINLPVAPLPRVDFPTIQVSATLPGASPETMAAAVITPLERRFGRIAGLTEMTSSSSLGSASLVLQFDLNRDVDGAARDVQAAIQAAASDLPSNLPNLPTYRKVNPSDSPILVFALTSKTLPLAEMFDAANVLLATSISQIDGVGQVLVSGGQQPAVRVQVDPTVLASLHLTLQDLRNTINLANVHGPKGQLQGPVQAYGLQTNGQLQGAAAYGPLVIASAGNTVVRLQDIAHVIDDVENNKLAAWFDGERAILLIVRRDPEANIIATIERVKQAVPILAKALSPAIDLHLAVDRSQTIRASVHDVQATLCLTVILVIAVVYVFLRSPTATLIPSMSIPLSLFGTFGVMYLLGYSLNNLSLMALTISTGFVVDDAIVVTENIARLIEEGKSALEAAYEGAKQITFTVISMTISLLAVFIPLFFMGGIVGRLFMEFAVTLSVAIVVSAMVSLTLIPTLCALFLKAEHHATMAFWLVWFEKGFAALHHGYQTSLKVCLQYRRLLLSISLLAMALTIYLYKIVPKSLFPQQDTGLIIGFLEGPQDISFETMYKRNEAINHLLKNDPDIDHIVSFIGAANGGTTNTGSMFMGLKPQELRHANADEIIKRLRPQLAKIPGLTVYLQAAQDLRVGGRSARTQYQYTLQDPNLAQLKQWSPRILARLKQLPELTDVGTDQQTAGLEADVDIDRDMASQVGLNMKLIDDALYDAFGQRQVSTVFTQQNQYRVVVEAKPEQQANPTGLENMYVATTGGPPVPLLAFSTINIAPTALTINHQGQFPAVTLSFNLAPGVALGTATQAIENAKLEMRLPAGLQAGFQGTAQAFGASGASQPWLILAALLTVYSVLGMLYESYIHPVTILSTLPSAGMGALLALMACHTDFGVIALIGILLLIGIVKKNAIMMIDFAIVERSHAGVSAEEAIYKACLLRFRPIMMTTFAALLGSLPLAFASGAGSELRQPLGIAIVGGLLVSQVLTLYTTPVIYLMFENLATSKKTSNKS